MIWKSPCYRDMGTAWFGLGSVEGTRDVEEGCSELFEVDRMGCSGKQRVHWRWSGDWWCEAWCGLIWCFTGARERSEIEDINPQVLYPLTECRHRSVEQEFQFLNQINHFIVSTVRDLKLGHKAPALFWRKMYSERLISESDSSVSNLWIGKIQFIYLQPAEFTHETIYT